MKVWLDGELVESDQVAFDAFSHGLTSGLGAFETLSAERGFCFQAERHFDRLRAGLRRLGLDCPENTELESAIFNALSGNSLADVSARVRITALAGSGSAVRMMVSAVPYQRPSGRVRLGISRFQRNGHSAIAGIKSVSYAESLLAIREAQQNGWDEVLMLNTAGQVCECATANVFLKLGGNWLTPRLSSGCLGGVMRGVALERSSQFGLNIAEADLHREVLDEAEGAFISNSLRGIQFAAALKGRTLPSPSATELGFQTAILRMITGEPKRLES